MAMLPLKIKKLNPSVPDPVYSTEGAAGLDLHATSEKLDFFGGVPGVEYGTGLAVAIPKGHVGLIFPRSSITSKTSLTLGNAVGIIDEDYRGEIKFQFRNLTQVGAKKYKVGERIGQLIVIPIPKLAIEYVTELDETTRGTGGFGSTN